MTTFLVTRHAGALEWARESGLSVDVVDDHLNVTNVRPEDHVIGTLPVNLAADVCARGGRYFHLSVDLPRELRGRELSAEELRACNARVEEYWVTRIVEGPQDAVPSS